MSFERRLRRPLGARNGPREAQNFHPVYRTIHGDEGLNVRLAGHQRMPMGFGCRDDEISENVLAMGYLMRAVPRLDLGPLCQPCGDARYQAPYDRSPKRRERGDIFDIHYPSSLGAAVNLRSITNNRGALSRSRP